jgi:trimethylamine:corrinoid methyltransferase-like protein
MAAKEADIEFILEYIGGPSRDPNSYQMWACRGAKKGCKKRVKKTKRHCADCVLPDMEDTVGEVMKRLERGDA